MSQGDTRKVAGWLLLVLGVASAVLGLSIAGVELYHAIYSRHPAIPTNVLTAALFLGAGASIIQTGNVRDTISILREAWPLVASRRPGGKRRTDPPKDESHHDS